MFAENVLNQFLNSIENNANRNALCIEEIFYTYNDLALCISKIRQSLILENPKNKNIGLITNNDIETYASIFALWLEGLAYVPINPAFPKNRNDKIIRQAEIQTILDSSKKQLVNSHCVINTLKLGTSETYLRPKEVSNKELAYILFTSGTTGEPKGVPISRSNLESFVLAFNQMGLNVTKDDKFLQMSDLTFDFSVMSYLIPLLNGSCFFTIPKGKIRYAYVYELFEDHKISFSVMVPSILHYLRPYFDEMSFPEMKYSLFCGEALPLDVTEEWSNCIPNAKIINVYGPTENTVFCTHYCYDSKNVKMHNGVLSVGNAMLGNHCIIIDNNNNIAELGEPGELCLSGPQLTPGYWKNNEKNKESFFTIDHKGIKKRFYRTGDLCSIDRDGDILYLDRTDYQTKIQGFRVELSEIEFYAKEFLKKTNVVATDFTNKIGNKEIGIIIESKMIDTIELLAYLKVKLPVYMIPTKIKFIDIFPLNSNEKLDRNRLKQIFKI